jgi:hypothetical protein
MREDRNLELVWKWIVHFTGCQMIVMQGNSGSILVCTPSKSRLVIMDGSHRSCNIA